MPFGDRTGPAGLGPRTGRAAGLCAGFPVPGYLNPGPGRGFGFFGRGRGGGRGWRNWYYATGLTGWQRAAGWPAWGAYGGFVPAGAPAFAPPAREQEVAALKSQAEFFQGALEGIRKRLEELEAKAQQG
jgi:hypothetical protein